MDHPKQQATIYIGLNDRITGVQKFAQAGRCTECNHNGNSKGSVRLF